MAAILTASQSCAAMVVLLAVFAMGGCRSIPDGPAFTTTVNKPIAAVENAAVQALATAGFDVQTRRSQYIEGYRPRRWGFTSGSGGETVGIWLDPESDNRTRIGVNTGRTSFGATGQRDWSSDIMRRILKELGPSE